MGFFFLNKYGFSFLFLFWFYVYFFFNIIIDKYSLSIIKSLLKDGAEIVQNWTILDLVFVFQINAGVWLICVYFN